MIQRISMGVALGGIFLLGACAEPTANTYTRSTSPVFFAALDSQPNGTKGGLSDGSLFLIQQTRVKSNLLCRDVQIVGSYGVEQQTYCKIKGGEWR